MSGFAHVTGQPDGPPTLPPFMLADGVAAQAATYAVMMALYHRDVHGGGGPAGRRQPHRAAGPPDRVVHPRLRPARDQSRAGSATASTPARRATPTGRPTTSGWPSRARRRTSSMRVYRAIDRPDLAEDPDYVDPVRRQERALEVDELVADWVARAHAGRGHEGVRGGRGGGGAGLRRRAAAGRRAPAGPGYLRRRSTTPTSGR